MYCVSHAFSSVYCCLVVICWERADLFALVGDVYCMFNAFPCGILGQVWYLIVSFPDLCCLSYSDTMVWSVLISTSFCAMWQSTSLIRFVPRYPWKLIFSQGVLGSNDINSMPRASANHEHKLIKLHSDLQIRVQNC